MRGRSLGHGVKQRDQKGFSLGKVGLRVEDHGWVCIENASFVDEEVEPRGNKLGRG